LAKWFGGEIGVSVNRGFFLLLHSTDSVEVDPWDLLAGTPNLYEHLVERIAEVLKGQLAPLSPEGTLSGIRLLNRLSA
jgi:hypothetical protein